ncbi:heavy-metal-associated domain-containing protein [Rurimicrobium arvi]|uniref:HMA domain-containing protein n=1 Tax=Rurimicrobium arvi TaxID=2049916 RepID=A0ABP8MNQ7_9BACT
MNKSSIFPIALFFISLFSIAARAQQTDSLRTAIITVANLHCNNDMPTIKKQLLNQDGIDEVSFTEIHGDRSAFTIFYHTAATSEQQIKAAIEATPGCDDPASRPYKVKQAKPSKK